jgi:hypothetical protein
VPKIFRKNFVHFNWNSRVWGVRIALMIQWVRYGLNKGLDVRQGQEQRLISKTSRPALGSTQPSTEWVPVGYVHVLGTTDIFRTRSDRPWGPLSLLYNRCRIFPGRKAAGAWRWPPTPSRVDVKERVTLYIFSSLWAFVPCPRVT